MVYYRLPILLFGGLMFLSDVASDLNTLGTALSADLVAWGSAVIGVALTAAAVIWVMRMMGRA